VNPNYKVKLEIFEGPLDLLLHLIKKNEVDIYDIPIAVITEQYLSYIDIIKSMNLDLAGEFLLMAATLVHIKSKMLLPIPEEADEEDEGIDPRAELVRRLIEYQQYKYAADDLMNLPLLGRDVFTRGANVPLDGLEETIEEGPLLTDISLFDLLSAFKDILARAPKTYGVDVTVDRFRIADKINHIMEVLGRDKSAVFGELFVKDAVRGEIIVTFLALLELCKLTMVKINQTDDGIIRVYAAAPKTAAVTEVSNEVH